MTFKEYLENLQKFTKEFPETLSLHVVASKNDEGNEYSPILFTPTKGYYEDGEFMPFSDFDYYGISSEQVNAICIN